MADKSGPSEVEAPKVEMLLNEDEESERISEIVRSPPRPPVKSQ